MKTIQELIEEGIKIKCSCVCSGILSGDTYAEWLVYCERLLRKQFPDDPQVIEFSEISKNADGNYVKEFDRLIGILKAFVDMPPTVPAESIDATLEKICTNFHRCVRSILNRHGNRTTLEMNDEYDVQFASRNIASLY